MNNIEFLLENILAVSLAGLLCLVMILTLIACDYYDRKKKKGEK